MEMKIAVLDQPIYLPLCNQEECALGGEEKKASPASK